MFDFSRDWPGNVSQQNAFQTPNPKRRRDGELVEANSSEVGFPVTAPAKKEKGQRPFWGSLRYKGLLAFLPIGKSEMIKLGTAGSGMETEEELGADGEGLIRAVEVVVVERPIWDAHKALPPRFFDGRN